MNRSLLELIHKEIEAGGAGVLCTVVGAKDSTPRDLGASMWVRGDGTILGTVGGGALEYTVIEKARALLADAGGPTLHEAVLREAESEGQAVCGGEMTILMEPMGQEAEVVIFGAGHVGRALAQAASAAGFHVTVWDEREAFANQEEIPWGKTLACPLEEALEQGLSLHSSSYAVVVTRGHALDGEVVRMLEGRRLAYLGLIGSRKKIAIIREKLLARGVSQKHLDRIFQPVGLPIGAETPEEIAVSILAEIIAMRRGADLGKLRRGFSNLPGPCFPRFEE